MKYIELFEENTKKFEKYLDKYCIIHFGVDFYIVHVKKITLKYEHVEFAYYSYDEKAGKVNYTGSTDISFNLFKPTGVYDTFGAAEKEYLILLNAKKYNI